MNAFISILLLATAVSGYTWNFAQPTYNQGLSFNGMGMLPYITPVVTEGPSTIKDLGVVMFTDESILRLAIEAENRLDEFVRVDHISSELESSMRDTLASMLEIFTTLADPAVEFSNEALETIGGQLAGGNLAFPLLITSLQSFTTCTPVPAARDQYEDQFNRLAVIAHIVTTITTFVPSVKQTHDLTWLLVSYKRITTEQQKQILGRALSLIQAGMAAQAKSTKARGENPYLIEQTSAAANEAGTIVQAVGVAAAQCSTDGVNFGGSDDQPSQSMTGTTETDSSSWGYGHDSTTEWDYGYDSMNTTDWDFGHGSTTEWDYGYDFMNTTDWDFGHDYTTGSPYWWH